MNCLHCGATTTNGLALCDLCQRKAATDLEFLPVYFRNLARWTPGRAGARPVPGSRVLYDGEVRGDGTGDRISDRLDEAMTTLTTWARVLGDDRPESRPRPLALVDAALAGDLPEDIDVSQRFAWLCLALDDRLTSVSTLEWCGEFVGNLARHEATLRGLTEAYVPGWYAGACRRRFGMATDEDDGLCGAPTYVVPGFTWVTCGVCGSTTYARDHLETVLNEARGWMARPKLMAEALVAMLDTEQSVPKLYDRIRKWDSLGWLLATRRLDSDGDPIGPKRYRLGDVIDLATGDTQARRQDASA